MNYWENNKKYIREKLRQEIEEKKEVVGCRLHESSDGGNIIVVEKDGNGYLLNKMDTPELYAKEIVEEIVDIEDYSTIFLFGISDGIIANAISESMKDTNYLVIYEPSLDVLKLALENWDISNLLKKKNTVLIDTIDGNDMLIDTVTIFTNLYNMKQARFYCQPNYENVYKEEYDLFLKQISYEIDMEYVKIETLMYYNEKWISAMMNNLLCGITAKDIVCLKKEFERKVDFEKTPAIIVAAGPSLDKNVDLLKDAKGKAFIFAADAALRTINMHGIKPDAVFTIDTETPELFFEGVNVNEIPVFMTECSSKEIVNMHKGIKVMVSSPSTVYNGFLIKKRRDPIPRLPISGSVGADAMILMEYLGFKTMIYIGQDLAYLGSKTHTEGVIAKETLDNTLTSEEMVVEGIDGHDVVTNQQFDLFRKWMEIRLENNNRYKVIDATEGGALIRGTEIMPFRQAIDEYCHGDVDFEEILNEFSPTFNDSEQVEFKEYIKKQEEDIAKLKEKIESSLEIYPQLVEMAKNHQEETEKFALLYSKVRDISSAVQENVFATELQVYNRYKYYSDAELIYDKETTVVQILEHMKNVVEGYAQAVECLEKDFREKVIERL